MRKSLVMLVLITMIATSFIVAVPPTSGSLDDGTNVIDDGTIEIPREDTDYMENGLSDDIIFDGKNEFGDDEFVFKPVSGISDLTDTEPRLVFIDGEEGPWPPDPEDAPSRGRGATNTSTLLYFQEAPKQVKYSEEESMIIEGVLLEDNNSDGERNSGDLPIEREWVSLEWAPGSEWWTEFDMLTEWENEDLNGTAGRFAVPYLRLDDDNTSHTINLFPNITSVALNPVELGITYKGVWTTDGARFYNLTPEIYNKLYDKRIGYDDDGDAAEKQYNGIDDDNDGVIDDGRPGIPAVGDPEPPHLWNNGIDDDNDGVIDDGYPGIRKVGNPEGVDEEILNGIDDDNDGLIDEDPYAFIARRGYYKRYYVEIWHKTKTTIDDRTPSHGLVDVGEEFTISGTVSDLSVAEEVIGQKTMRMYWDGARMMDAVARPSVSGYFSEYEFTFQVPMSAAAGPHTVTVEFSPGFNITNNNYFDPSNATTTIWVRRPTMVIFDNVDINNDVTWVYRGNTIYINGSIVDKLTYISQGTRQGPKLSIGGVDYGIKYRYNVMWGESVQPWSKIWTGLFISDDFGNFSIQYDLPAGSQDLGPVEVYLETNFDDNPYLSEKIYYSNSEGSTTFMVRSTTEISLWIDQNKNDINDERELDTNGEPFNSYITRKEFDSPDGRTKYDWNYARIRGVLKDMSRSSGAIVVGVPNQEVTLYWGFGKTWQKTYELRTDDSGRFDLDIPIGPSHALGPVPVRASYNPNFFTNYFDSSSYIDNDGQPFSVVSFTTLEINASVAIKGKPIDVFGTLQDDRDIGIGNRTINLYRLESWDGNFNNLRASGGLGSFIGSATTNSIGKFRFSDHIIEERMSVGTVFIVAKFAGSEEFPFGLGGVRYLPNDAYKDDIADPVEMTITAETVLVLDNVPDVLVRNAEARITGKLLERYRGKTVNRGVGGQNVKAHLKQGEELFELGTGRTKRDPNLPEFDGFFEIKTSNVERNLKVGSVEVIVEFIPVTDKGVSLYQYSENRTSAEVWSSTRIKEIHFGPRDTDKIPDGKFNIVENEVDNLVFTFQILEGTFEKDVPVTSGIVYLNISMGSYMNTTRAITDNRGRIHFNFSSKLKDTATGNFFTLQSDQDDANVTVSLFFVGKPGYMTSQKERFGTYERYEPPETPPPPLFLILFAILLVIIVGGIALFLFYRYIERKRRLKSLKKIIKKAADQLEAGNPYSYIIFKAYQKMGAHLRRYGFMRRDADTFREFEDAVRAALPIDEKSLDSFLDILEEARYSKHVIGETHKQKAIGCLRGVESSLENIILDEEAALRQMELADEDYVETDILGPDK